MFFDILVYTGVGGGLKNSTFAVCFSNLILKIMKPLAKYIPPLTGEAARRFIAQAEENAKHPHSKPFSEEQKEGFRRIIAEFNARYQ
jgi:hypothetical protein